MPGLVNGKLHLANATMTSQKVALHHVLRESLEVNRMRSRLGERSKDGEFVQDLIHVIPLVSFVDLISFPSVPRSIFEWYNGL